MTDDGRKTVRDAIASVVADLDKGIAREIAVSRGVERVTRALPELVADNTTSKSDAALAAWGREEMKRLGDGRDAAMKAARRKFPKDPQAQEIFAQRLRRIRLREKKRAVLVCLPNNPLCNEP